MSAATLDCGSKMRTRSDHAPCESWRRRAARLLHTPIDFVPNERFASDDQADDENVDSLLLAGDNAAASPAGLPAHLRRLCESDLLTPEAERTLFREMNRLKYRASVLCELLSVQTPDRRAVEAIDDLLAKAQTIRDHLIKANMRLVISIVKKFVSPSRSFDDMLSDGSLTLMQAVEKFDFDRGFRFSTYAYRSIARNLYRSIMTARQEESRYAQQADDRAFVQDDGQAASSMTDRVWHNLRRQTATMLDRLDRRERFIIRSRYALGAHRKVRTFQYLADKLGVSKERVRQLEQRAVGKLQSMASELDADDLFGAALA